MEFLELLEKESFWLKKAVLSDDVVVIGKLADELRLLVETEIQDYKGGKPNFGLRSFRQIVSGTALGRQYYQ